MMRSMWSRRSIAMLAPMVAVLATRFPASAQRADTSSAGMDWPRAALLAVGTFHFDYPNLDVVKVAKGDQIDVLSPSRQREVEELVERLAAFRPTKVAVEVRPGGQAALDSMYRAYLAGRWQLGRGEVYQVGFRLAPRLGLARVDAVDEERDAFFVRLAQDRLAPREAELMATDSAWRNRLRRLRVRDDSAAGRPRTLREMYVAMNDPERIRRDQMTYHVGFFKFDGEPGGYLGADFIAGWYDRNLRIFRNLQRITRGPDERVLLLIGSGHLAILRFLAQTSPEYRLHDASEYLAR